MDHDPIRGSGLEALKTLTGRVGLRQEVFEISWVESGRVGSGRVGSGRVGSGRVGSGRVGSGRVRRFSSITGRPGSHPEPIRPARNYPSREER